MERPVTRFDRHSRKIAIALWLFAFLVGITVLEWSLTPSNGRYWAYGSGPGPERMLRLREWTPNTDYRRAPPPERKRYANGKEHEIYALATDAQGFIEPAIRHEKPELSIVFLGGSTTECLFVAPENRFPYRVGRELESSLGLKVNGINAARSGNNSMHSLLLLLGKVVPLRPDYVVLMEAINDMGTLSNGTYWSAKGPRRFVDFEDLSVGRSLRILTNVLIPYTSDLVGRASRPIRQFFRQVGAPAEDAREPQLASERNTREEMGKAFAKMLRSLISMNRVWGIKPVLMTQVYVRPKADDEQRSHFLVREHLNGGIGSPDDVASTHDYFNSVIRDVASSENVLLIDLARAHAWRFGDVYDGIHFTDRGSTRVANTIARAIREDVLARQGAHN